MNDKINPIAREPDEASNCVRCGKPEWKHMEIIGAGKVCPVSATTFRAAARTPTKDRETTSPESEAR
jgi:hypothetical protein